MVSKIYKDQTKSVQQQENDKILDRDSNPEVHEFLNTQVSTNARVTPLQTDLTTPKSDNSGVKTSSRTMRRNTVNYSRKIAASNKQNKSTCKMSSMSEVPIIKQQVGQQKGRCHHQDIETVDTSNISLHIPNKRFGTNSKMKMHRTNIHQVLYSLVRVSTTYLQKHSCQ